MTEITRDTTLPWLADEKHQLSSALDKQRLGHAPLFTGPAGVGKRILARWLIRRILCQGPVDGQPCGQCRSCQLIAAGSHPDLFQLLIPEDKKEIPVDSVRQLTAGMQLTASISNRRAGFIEPAEAMNTNAANALLKTLEEPAANAWLVLVSDHPGRLPATIRSRCQQIAVRIPSRQMALDWLREQHPDQSAEHLDQALSLSADAPLAASRLLIDDGLAFGSHILDGLIAVTHGQGIQSVIDDQWLADSALTWRWLAIWTERSLKQTSGLISSNPGQSPELPTGQRPSALATLWQSALRGAALARSSARQDLLIGKWLLEWKSLSESTSQSTSQSTNQPTRELN